MLLVTTTGDQKLPAKNFNFGEMKGLAFQWTGPDVDALLALDTGRRLLAFLREFIVLVAAHSAPDSPIIRQLDALLYAADVLHDRLVRGLFLILGGLIELADTEEEALRWQTLRDRLFPEGMAVVSRSWLEEGAAAADLDTRLDDADRQLLNDTLLPGGRTMASVVTRYQGAGRTLLEKNAERAGERSGQRRADRGRLTQARNQFIQAVALMRTTIEFQDDLDPKIKDRLLGKLDEVEKLADARAARRRAAGLTEVPEDETTVDAADGGATPGNTPGA